MSDLIERQAAIDAVHKEFDDCIVWDESGMTTANEVERILDSVPSAQPEPEWIPVTERMPELDEAGYSEKVLVCCRNTSIIDIAEYRMVDGIGDWYIGDLEDKFTDFGCPVLAWMPLPERYHDPL